MTTQKPLHFQLARFTLFDAATGGRGFFVLAAARGGYRLLVVGGPALTTRAARAAAEIAQQRATASSSRARAALAGDSSRAKVRNAIGAVRPAGGPAVTGPMLAFYRELYESIQRYEALAGATEEAGTSHGQVAPELAELEAPEATEAEMLTAREAVASEVPTVRSDVPILVNDSVLRVLAAFQSPALSGKIANGLSRSGRYVPMIHRIFAEEGLPQDLAWIAFIESSFLPHARSPRRPRASGSSCLAPAASTA
jgi:hypothetical protein